MSLIEKSDIEELERLKNAMMESMKKDNEHVCVVEDDDYDNESDADCDYVDDEEETDDEINEEAESPNDSEEYEETFEESIAFLDDMVGMEAIKEKLLRIGRYVQWKKHLETQGIDTSKLPSPNMTFMFLGEPGTGKTTVAYRMGRILHSLGLVQSKKVMEFHREDLVGENYGSEEKNTKDALRRSYGSVFFLDEAYQCFKQSKDKRDPAYHILETMMACFDQPGRCIIMAGYKNEMLEIFKVNPGFRSRIPDDNIIEFPAVTEQSLVDVAINNLEKMEFLVSPEAYSRLQAHIHSMWKNKDNEFGNAREIKQLTDSIVINHANRIVSSSLCDDFIITEADITKSIGIRTKKDLTRPHLGFF